LLNAGIWLAQITPMSGGAPNERLSDFSRHKRRTAKSNER
jgi:hypothetical protein